VRIARNPPDEVALGVPPGEVRQLEMGVAVHQSGDEDGGGKLEGLHFVEVVNNTRVMTNVRDDIKSFFRTQTRFFLRTLFFQATLPLKSKRAWCFEKTFLTGY